MNLLNKGRFEYLDGIRGVTALIVVVNHFRNAFYEASINSSIFSFLWDMLKIFFLKGDFCVEIFFVLSGFVLAYNSLNRPDFLNKQWLKRLYRLVVPVLITSFFYFLFSNNGLFFFEELSKINKSDWVSHHWLVHYSFPQFIFRCLYDFMLFSDWQFVMNINSSLWTIPIELYFSYILFVLFMFFKFVKNQIIKNIIWLIYTVIVLSIFKFNKIEFGLLFFLGTLFAMNYSIIINFYNTNLINILSVILTVLLTYLYEMNLLINIEFTFIPWNLFLAALYVLLAIRIDVIQKMFSFSIIKWLGRISFSLYLLHLLIIGSISSKLYLIYPYLRSDIGLFILLIFTILISTLISHLYTVYIDEKLMKYYDQVYKFILNRFKNILANIK